MSVFSDFQRMWMMRFPDNSLSSEWEQDVKASLQRHKQKIIDLSKELEQEMLYVNYLEKLLADVEQYRSNGGDPTALFSNNKDIGVGGITPTSMKTINNNEDDKNDDIGNVNALEGCSDENISNNNNSTNNDGDDGAAVHENNDANDNNLENRDEVCKLNLIDFNLKLRLFFLLNNGFIFIFQSLVVSLFCCCVCRSSAFYFNLCKFILLHTIKLCNNVEVSKQT